MFSAKINRLEGSEREDLPRLRRERECGFDRRNNLDQLSFQFSFSSPMGSPIIFFSRGSPTCD